MESTRLPTTEEERDQSEHDGAGNGLGQQLWDTCRAHARPRLDGIVERLESSVEPAECVLASATQAKLQDLSEQVRRRPLVHGRLGVEAGERGLLCLFAGGDGAGKTYAAQALARELEIDLYRLDLGRVTSAYGGGLQRRVRSIFDTAAQCGAALLIEGTDLLCGARRSVDELELLEQLEHYSGLAILTAERAADVDPALARNLGCVLEFEMPGAEQRAEIWRRVLAQYPVVANVDYGDLAQLDLAVEKLRSVALDAAFLATEAGEALEIAHVRRAAGLEAEVCVPDVSLLG